MSNVLAVQDPTSAGVLSPTAPAELRVLHAVLTRYSPPAYSPHTGQAYLSDLRIFGAWCAENHVQLFAVERTDVEAWMRELGSAGEKPRTVNRRLAAVGAFYAEANDQGFVDRVPTQRVRRVRVDEPQKLGIDREEARRVLETARVRDAGADQVRGPQEEALVRLVLVNGLRASEAASLTAGSIGREDGYRVVRFVSKGRKARVEPLADDTAAAVDRLLAHRRGSGELGQSAPLFVVSSGNQMSRFDVRDTTIAIGRQAGVMIRLNPHDGRHAFVTLSLKAGVPLERVQEGAAHADPRTTIGYNRALQHLELHATRQLSEYLKKDPTVTGGQAFREAWVAGVRRHYPGEAPASYVTPWEETPEWERACATIVFGQIAAFVLATEGGTVRLTREQRGRFVAICWLGQIHGRFTDPKPAYVADWAELPAWQREVDADIFERIEGAVLAETREEDMP